MFDHLWNKTVFVVFKWNFLFHFVLTASCFTLDHTEKSDSIFLTLFPSYIYTHHRLLQAAESQLSQPLLTLQILQALNHIHISFMDSLQYIHVLLLNGESKLTILHQMCFTCAEGQITSITFLKLSLMQPRRVLISLLQWHITGSQSTSTLGSFPAGLRTSVSS